MVFGSKLVSCDAAGLPFGMVSEPRRRLEPTLAGGLVEYLAVKMHFRVSAEFLELCQRASTLLALRLDSRLSIEASRGASRAAGLDVEARQTTAKPVLY